MLRIGIWFDEQHCSFGGPTVVLLGTIIGLIQDSIATKRPIRILINEQGDVNWVVNHLREHETIVPYIRNPLIGPLAFIHGDALTKDPTTNPVWSTGKRFVFASQWFADLLQRGLPMTSPRSYQVWESGVDTEYFTPGSKKTQDYFIYFKSQHYDQLQHLHVFLFQNYFKYTGTTLHYYHYSPEMLKEQAQKSRFCIYISNTETQGLGALEILSCDCPMFILDKTVFETKEQRFEGATSATSWDDTCGMKAKWADLEKALPKFLENLSSYTPRKFVSMNYSFQAAAHRLRDILDS